MKKSVLLMVVSFFLLTGCTYRCFHPVWYEGDYRGKVIDAETKEPIEGVVVLGVWYSQLWSPGGGVSEYYDARETVTDKNGEFTMPGKGIRILSNLVPVDLLIFKAGYEYEAGSWTSLKVGYLAREKVKWEGDKAIIPLKKLTMEERRKQGTPDFYVGKRYDEQENLTHSCLPKNIKLLPKEVNKELLEQGRKPYDLQEGRCEK